jgi:hypothetical protein
MNLRTFTLTAEHLKLLREMYVGWQDCEYGAPEIDPKRPYGNSSVEADIHEILTGETEYELTEAQRERYAQLHRETQTAMQILLQVAEIPLGVWQNNQAYGTASWSHVTVSRDA